MSRRNRGRADGALVTNASDERQVREAGRIEDAQERQRMEDMRAVLALPAGQRVLWWFMAECKVFQTVWDPSARIHYNAGKQDIGHFIMEQIERADPGALYEMHKTVNQQEQREADARVAERLHQREDDDDDDQ